MLKRQNRFGKMLLRTKLILLYITIIAIPIITVSFIIFRDLRNEAINKALIEANHNVRALVVDLNYKVEKMRSIDQVVTNSFEFKNFLANEDDISIEDYITFQNGYLDIFEKLQITNSEINALRFFVKNDKVLEMWPYIYAINRMKSENLSNLILNADEEIWYLNHYEDKISWDKTIEQKKVVSLYHSIYYPKNCFLGIVEINISTDDFYKKIFDASSEHSIYYVASNDNIISNMQNPTFISEGLSENNLRKISQLLTVEGDGKLVWEGKNLYVNKVNVPYINADIVSIVFIDTINKQIKNNRNRIIHLTLFVLILLIWITNRIIKMILRKLKIVVSSMRQVQNGDLNIDIPVYGEDEMGELAHHFRKMLKRINELIDKVLKKQAAIKDAEIRALQTQINSHFIYNVLENIKMMAVINYEYDISNSITLLGNLMRYSMDWKKHKVKVEDEIDYIKKYIALFNICSDYPIQLNIDIEPNIMKMKILKITIQPLVENAIEHGIIPKTSEGKIIIRSVIILDETYIEVIDDGIGMNEVELEELRQSLNQEVYDVENDHGTNSIGLGNVKNRLELFYGYDKDEIYIESVKNQYTLARIKLKEV